MVMEPIDREKVMQVVRFRGPIIPNELRKALKQGDTMLLGAMLSELASKGRIKISKTKIGGSPFYYDPTKPEGLERVAQHLNEKDQRTFALLKEKKILRDDRQEPLIRVSLRNIKDFAQQLTINAPEGELTYWHYYLISEQEAEELIKEDLGLIKKKEPEPIPEPEVKPAPEKEPERKGEPAPERPKERPAPKPAEKPKKETPKESSQETLELEEINDSFYRDVREWFEKNKIMIKEQHLIRKKSEIDFVIQMPTPVGKVEYYCKAKSKKKSNEGDLSSVKLQAQARSLPGLYLTTGEITKKAKDALATSLKGLVVQELH